MRELSWEIAAQRIEDQSRSLELDEFCPDPSVSVSLVAYNHADFIVESLESILAQETDFLVEIVIGDDHSSDETTRIVEEYVHKHPDRIRAHFSTSNLGVYTGNGRLNHFRNLMSCRGKYIAMIEADDFWTDHRKLQRQVDYLEANPTAAGCFHDCITVDHEGKQIDDFFGSRSYKSRYEQSDCLDGLGSSYGTASLVFRRDVWQVPPPDYIVTAFSDYTLDLLITERGTLDYLPFHMSAYRIHEGGVWQGTDQSRRATLEFDRAMALYHSPELMRKHRVILERLLTRRWRQIWRHGVGSNILPGVRACRAFGMVDHLSPIRKAELLCKWEVRDLAGIPWRGVRRLLGVGKSC